LLDMPAFRWASMTLAAAWQPCRRQLEPEAQRRQPWQGRATRLP